MSDPRPLLYRAFDQTALVVRGVSADQLSLPTPCREFDVVDLLSHIVGAANRVAAVGRGESQTGAMPEPTGISDDGWSAAFDEAHQQVLAIWARDDVLDRKMDLPFGTLEGAAVAGAYTMELTAHSWDLAAATGQVDILDNDLADASLPMAQRMLPPDYRGGPIPFEAVVPVAADASSYDRLAAYLGRRVG